MNDERFEMLLLALEATGKKSIADDLRLRDSLKNGKNWTRAYPSEQGWYWIKHKDSQFIEIKKFYKNNKSGEVFSSDEEFYEYYAKDVYKDHLFCGPLKEPRE